MPENSYIEELIVRFFMQEINEDELRILEAWLEEAPENKAFFFQMKNASDTFRRSRLSEKEKEESWQGVYKRLREATEIPAVHTKKRKIVWGYVAAVILALIAGWGLHELGHVAPPPSEKELISSVFNEVIVEKGGRGTSLVLADGTRVTLNADTRFRYPVDFSHENRMAFLAGEAFFEVSENKESPFLLRLEKQDITVLGTSFNVQAYNDEPYSVVTLMTGNISLEIYNEEGVSVSQLFLKPNQQVHSDNKTGSVTLQNVDTAITDVWMKKIYKFKDEPLNSIVKRLERYYDIPIYIENESLKQIKYTGSFSLEQDIEDILQIIDYEKKFKVKRLGKEIYITRK